MFSLFHSRPPRYAKEKTRNFDLSSWGYVHILGTDDTWVYSPVEESEPTIIIEVIEGEWYGNRVSGSQFLSRAYLNENKSWRRFLENR